ncbi:MAG: sulfatase-like hydrolase/transferase [Kiritimatiellales bacterium]|nr:sulfatase-like hydrolase/transferase [Kiritimatiellales bacterium]
MKHNRRNFIQLSTLAAAPVLAGSSATAATNRQPNILLIVTDQQHADAIAALGNPHLTTPALDKLVKNGMSFRRSYTTNPVCSPARSSIFTGRTSSETGVYVNGITIRADIPNIGQWLGANGGYDCVYAGKWHLKKSYDDNIPGFRVLHTGIGGLGTVCDTAVSMSCASYILSRPKQTKPFFMVAAFMQPHDICEWLRHNTTVPDEFPYPSIRNDLPPLPDNFEFDRTEPQEISSRRNKIEGVKGNWTKEHWRYYRWSYYRHIEQLDGEVGRLLDALRMKQLDSNTLVIFTSDHGEGMGHHQMVRKSTPYDEAARVPMVVRLPGKVRQGADEKQKLVSGLDITPTICDYAGVKPPPHQRGFSMRPLLEGRPMPWRSHLVFEHNGDTGRTILTDHHKYSVYRKDPTGLLFDLKSDPLETRNLASDPAHADTIRRHRELIKAWEKSLDLDTERMPETAGWARKLA